MGRGPRGSVGRAGKGGVPHLPAHSRMAMADTGRHPRGSGSRTSPAGVAGAALTPQPPLPLRGERGETDLGRNQVPPREPRIAAARRLPDGDLPLSAMAMGKGGEHDLGEGLALPAPPGCRGAGAFSQRKPPLVRRRWEKRPWLGRAKPSPEPLVAAARRRPKGNRFSSAMAMGAGEQRVRGEPSSPTPRVAAAPRLPQSSRLSRPST